MTTPRHMLASLLLLMATLTGCSTDEICDQACLIWEDECGYSDYTYPTCFDDCKWEGDWSDLYLDCLKSANSCSQVESCG